MHLVKTAKVWTCHATCKLGSGHQWPRIRAWALTSGRGGKEKRKTKHRNAKCSKLDSSLTRVFKKLQKPYFLGTLTMFLTEESACSAFTSVMKTAGIKERGTLLKPWIVYDPNLGQWWIFMRITHKSQHHCWKSEY